MGDDAEEHETLFGNNIDDEFDLGDALLDSPVRAPGPPVASSASSASSSSSSGLPPQPPVKRPLRGAATSPPTRQRTLSPSDSDSDSDGNASDVEDDQINWERGSKMLENVQVKFKTRQQCSAFRHAIVVGMDPGEKNTMTATMIDTRLPVQRKSVTVRRTFLYRPYTLFRRRLQEEKEAAGIQIVESLMPPMTLSGIKDYLKYLETDGNRRKMHAFYHDRPWFIKKTWDHHKAQQASYDYGIKAILNLGGASEGRRKIPSDQAVVFAIGLGSFNTQTGLPSKHSALEKKFVVRVSRQKHMHKDLCHHLWPQWLKTD